MLKINRGKEMQKLKTRDKMTVKTRTYIESEDIALVRKIMRESKSASAKWYIPREAEWFKSATQPTKSEK